MLSNAKTTYGIEMYEITFRYLSLETGLNDITIA